jgi:hypothetical protein
MLVQAGGTSVDDVPRGGQFLQALKPLINLRW